MQDELNCWFFHGLSNFQFRALFLNVFLALRAVVWIEKLDEHYGKGMIKSTIAQIKCKNMFHMHSF